MLLNHTIRKFNHDTEFKNIEDMANFWDNHDSTEFEAGEIEAVEYKPKRVVLTVGNKNGAEEGIRTLNPRLGKPMLYH